MTGTGALVKSGSAGLTISGSISLGGAATLAGGALVVAGDLGASSLTVQSGTTLSGTGQINAATRILSGGALITSDAASPLKVNADASLADGAFFVRQIAGRDGVASTATAGLVVTASGASFTAGGTFVPVISAPAPAASFIPFLRLGDQIRLVAADRILGSFSSVDQPAGLAANNRVDILYDARGIRMAITPASYQAFALSAGSKSNAVAVGQAIDRVRPAAGSRNGTLQPFFNAVYGLDSMRTERALRQVSGELHAHVIDATTATVRAGLDTVQDLENQAGGSSNGLWMQYVHADHDRAGTATAGGFDSAANGFLIGRRGEVGPGLGLGMAVGYSRLRLSDAEGARATGHLFSAYGHLAGRVGDALTIKGAVGLSLGHVRTRRTLGSTSGDILSSSRQSSRAMLVDIEARYRLFEQRGFTAEAFAGLQAGRIRGGGSKESSIDPAFALQVGGKTIGLFENRLGGEIGYQGPRTSASVAVTWRYASKDSRAFGRSVSLGPASWRIGNAAGAGEGVEYAASLGHLLRDNLTAFASWRYRDLSGSSSDQRYSAGLALRF